MKTTLAIVATIILVSIFTLSFKPERLKADNTRKACCNVTIQVLSKGQPVSGCLVIVTPDILGGQCTTGDDGKCTICVGENANLTAVATCCGEEQEFISCSEPTVTINCP
jgi:hypothetical protein